MEDFQGRELIHWHCTTNDTKQIIKCLNKTPDKLLSFDYFNRTPLDVLIQQKHYRTIECLLQHSSFNQHEKLVEKLVDYAFDQQNETTLILAAKYHPKIYSTSSKFFETLIQNGLYKALDGILKKNEAQKNLKKYRGSIIPQIRYLKEEKTLLHMIQTICNRKCGILFFQSIFFQDSFIISSLKNQRTKVVTTLPGIPAGT